MEEVFHYLLAYDLLVFIFRAYIMCEYVWAVDFGFFLFV
jgi:hypothetical protein